MLIVGCGNRRRGDDAAGILVAEQLRDLGVPVQICSGDAFALIEAWETADDAVVIDAVVTGAPPGTLHIWDGCQALPACLSTTSTHDLGLAQAIALGRALDRLPARLRVWGIEGRRFDLGSRISRAVREAAHRVAEEIAGELGVLARR